MIDTLKNLFDFFTPKQHSSASIAKERLKVIVAHERNKNTAPDFLPELQREIMAVIAKYVNIDIEQVSVDFEEKNGKAILELNVTLPDQPGAAKAAAPKGRKKKG